MKPKRFLVFGIDEFYPAGGWSDLKCSHDTYEEALAWINQDLRVVGESSCGNNSDYYQIVDIETGREVDF